MSKEFNQALGQFVTEMASGGAIRHLSDLGYTVDEIVQKLDYPTPKEKVAEIVFQYYIDTGKVCLAEPREEVEKTSFVKDQGAYGRTSMRKVVEKVAVKVEDYVPCDFGKQMYQKKKIMKNLKKN